MKRKNLSSGAEWEEKVGYSRAVRIGNVIEISGTVATDGKNAIALGDPHKQAIFILEKIKEALESMGASLEDVVRTRMFVTNIEQWQEVGRAHGEFFKEIKPVTTMVEVSRLISPDYLVEIEASAIIA